MKLIGITLFAFAVFWYLFSKGKEYDKMPDTIRAQIKTLTKISDLVRFRNLTKEEIMNEVFQSGRNFDSSPLQLSNANGEFDDFDRNSYRNSGFDGENDDNSNYSDNSILAEFFDGFGKSDTESELARIELYKKELEDMLEDFTKECKNKSKLYKNMSFLASAFIIVIFI